MYGDPNQPHARLTKTRREFLRDAFCGFGGLAFSSMLHAESVRGGAMASRATHFEPKAKSVIFLFMSGGPSHLETFDPKPLLNKLHGQKRPEEFGKAEYQFVESDALILGTKRTFKKYGQSGIEVSDLFPHMATCVDDLAVIRSCYGDSVVHSAAMYELFTGRVTPGAPSMGSWLTYGLGSESDSLPGYVVMTDPKGALPAGQPMYTQGFLPANFQPTMFRPGENPVLNLNLPNGISLKERKRTLDLIGELNRANLNEEDHEFSARIDSYDLAFKMQTEAPEALDLSKESQETMDLYGIGGEHTNDYGRRCLMARKLVENGARFITVVSGGGTGDLMWDAHKDIEENHVRMAQHTDQPVAGLIKDLKRRGLLDSTLVLWGGEFGRSPEAQAGIGRDHHNLGFTMWMAGGGIKGGQVVGATDEIGLHAIERPYHFRDIHNTILHQLGLDQHKLTYPHMGRDERLTFLEGKLVREII